MMIQFKVTLFTVLVLFSIVQAKPIAQQLYEEKLKITCNDSSAAEINILSRCTATPPRTLQALDQLSEQLIFEPIAKSELNHYSCLENLFGKLEKDPNAKKGVIANTCSHMDELKSLAESLRYFKDLKESYQKANDPMIRVVSKTDLQKRDAIVAEVNPLIAAIEERISSLRSSDLLLSSDEIYNKVYSKLESGFFTDGKSASDVCSYLYQNTDSFLAEDREANRKSKEFLESVFPNGEWLSNSDLKEALWNSASRTYVVESIERTSELGSSALCRMDARYGAGAEIRDRMSLIAKLGLGFGIAGVSRLIGTAAFAKRSHTLTMAARATVMAEVGLSVSLGLRDAIRNCEAKVGTVSARKLCSQDKDAPLDGILNRQTALSNCIQQSGVLAFQTALGGFSIASSFKNLGTTEQIIEAQNKLARIYPRTTNVDNTLVISEKIAKGALSNAVFKKIHITGGGQIDRVKMDAAIRAAEVAHTTKMRVNVAAVIKTYPLDDSRKKLLQEALDKLTNMGGTGPEVAAKNLERFTREITVNNRPAAQMVDNFLKSNFAKLEAEVARTTSIKIKTQKLPTTHETIYQSLNVRPGASMAEIEKHFDTIARKASAPKNTGEVHEVDTAFSSGGIATRHIHVAKNGHIDVPGESGEKVFAVGHVGAINFMGKRSNEGGERFYALIYPKGFVRNYGADLKEANHVTTGTATGEKFKKIAEEKGKVFVVRKESTNSTTGGQVHLHTSDEFKYLNIDGEVISQIGWMQKNAIGVVEFDHSGRVLMVRSFSSK